MFHRPLLRGLALVLLATLATLSARGETCADTEIPSFEDCATPARVVPASLWGALVPIAPFGSGIPRARDHSYFDHATSTFFDPGHVGWFAIDGEAGFLFTAGSVGFQVWDARGSRATNPIPLAYYDIFDTPFFLFNLETKFYFRDVDAPPGDPTIVATALVDSGGIVVFDTTSPGAATVLYQDHGEGGYKNGYGVYATTLGSRAYAFLAAQLPAGGLYVYDLDAARSLAPPCVENAPDEIGCPGVFQGKLGARSSAQWVDGAGNYVAFSSGSLVKGLEIWDVADPANPRQRLSGLANEPVGALALWQGGATFYLAARVGSETRVYDVSCIAGSGSCGLGTPVQVFTTPSPAGSDTTLTWSSTDGGRSFLYAGDNSRFGQGEQHEWMIEVTSGLPGDWTDITPPARTIMVDTVNGPEERLTGYWGWYYMGNPTGTNWVAPMGGKWMGSAFYRAGYSILDVHSAGAGAPPSSALFRDGFESGGTDLWSNHSSSP